MRIEKKGLMVKCPHIESYSADWEPLTNSDWQDSHRWRMRGWNHCEGPFTFAASKKWYFWSD